MLSAAPSISYIPHPSQFLRGHAGLGAHLESGSRQVGDGNILEVILQGVDERGHCKLECVHILYQDSLMEEEDQVLHVTFVGGGEPFLAPTTKDGDSLRAETGPDLVSPQPHSDPLKARMRSMLSISLQYKHISSRPFGYSLNGHRSPLTLDLTLCLRITDHILLILEPTSLA